MDQQDYFTHFEPSQSSGGPKMVDPQEQPPDPHKQNLACLRCDPSKAKTHSGEMMRI